MSRVPCMEAVVAVLEAEGADTVFGAPGAAILPLHTALLKSRIRHLTVRHEQGATHAADGWARATGKVGVTVGTSVPEGPTMITGLCTAFADSVPIICVTGDAPRATLHREASGAVDIVEIAKPVTKWAVRPRAPSQVPWVFREAFRIARSGRPGPVLIVLPQDVQLGTCLYKPELESALPVLRPEPRLESVRAALDMILSARRPLILAGGGVIGAEAWDELRELAEYLQIPVQTTLMGKGAFPEGHPLFAGTRTQTRWGNATFLRSDLVLAIGARFCDRHTGDLEVYRRGRRFIHVDIEATQIGRVFEPDLGIVGHARPTLVALSAQARQRSFQRTPGDWVEQVTKLRHTPQNRADLDHVPIRSPRVYRELNLAYGPDTTFVTAIGLTQLWSGQPERTFLPRHYLVCGQAGPWGWEIPAAIGAKCALPDQTVVAVVGDHFSQFLVAEIAVAARYHLAFVIVMVNNEYLGHDMNHAVDPHHGKGRIDHVKLMEALGCPARRVEQPGDIADALRWANLESETAQLPVLVEITLDREAGAVMGTSPDAAIEYEPVPELVHNVD